METVMRAGTCYPCFLLSGTGGTYENRDPVSPAVRSPRPRRLRDPSTTIRGHRREGELRRRALRQLPRGADSRAQAARLLQVRARRHEDHGLLDRPLCVLSNGPNAVAPAAELLQVRGDQMSGAHLFALYANRWFMYGGFWRRRTDRRTVRPLFTPTLVEPVCIDVEEAVAANREPEQS